MRIEAFGSDDTEVDEEESENSQWMCVDCGAASPKTRTAHTLISSKHGWRLSRFNDSNGGYRFEWRCPQCWSAFKQREDRPSPQTNPPTVRRT